MAELGDFEAVRAGDVGSRRRALAKWAEAGELLRLYPGVYVPAVRAHELAVQLRAAQLFIPTGTFVGTAALTVLGGWPKTFRTVAMVSPTVARREGALTCRRGTVDPEWIVIQDDLRLVRPPFAVAYLAAFDDGEAIDWFLRSGGRLDDVRAAAVTMKGWWGTPKRRAVIHDSRALPWGASERLLHRILRAGGIKGWVANYRVIAGGNLYFLDAALPGHRLYLEADGYEFHSSRATFESDRRRHNALQLAGWRGLHFTWAMLQDADYVLETVRGSICNEVRAQTGAAA